MIKQLFQFTKESSYSNIDLLQKQYNENGIIQIKHFLDKQELFLLTNEIDQIEKDALEYLKSNWKNHPTYFYSFNPMLSSKGEDFATKEYFLKSQHHAHVFFENHTDELIINRIGHGMHLIEKYSNLHRLVYQNYTLKRLLISIGLIRPICHLSVYIPKYPKNYGSKVNPHQEATFACTYPTTVVVLWIALEDASVDNACMWGILGSNKWPLKYISYVDHTNRNRYFKQMNNVQIPKFPNDKSEYIPLIADAGDVFIFHGHFVHCSPNNNGNRTRKAISMQFIDTINTYYPQHNWITAPNYKYIYVKGS